LALTLTSTFAAYNTSNYATAPVVVAQDSDTNFTNQSFLGLASMTTDNVYLYAGTNTINNVTTNLSASNWNLFYRQLNTTTLASTQNNTASVVAPSTVFFLNNYVVGFGVDNTTNSSNLYAYQTPLASGATVPGRLQLSNNTNTNASFSVSVQAFAAIGTTVYVAYYAAANTVNITSFTVGATTPGTPFSFSTTYDTPGSLALLWGEALGSSQLFAVWTEANVLKDGVVDVSKKTVGSITPITYNSTTYPIYVPFVTDKKLYGELFVNINATSGILTYYVRTTANGTFVQIAAYPANTSTIASVAPYSQYLAVFFQSQGASNGTNYAYEIWDLTAYNATSVQPRKLYLTIDSSSTQVPFRVVSGGYYTLLFNNKQGNGTLTNVQVGLLLGSSYLASVLGFLLTIVAGLLLF
jgi:hypothetical protein